MGRFELESLTEYTDLAVLEEIRRVAEVHSEGPFTLAAFKRLSPRVSANTIRRRFGSWKTALQEAGLGHLSPERFQTLYQERLNRGRAMSDDELIVEMQRVHRLTGRDVLTKEDFNRLSGTCYEAVWKRFGGWHDALERAGIGKADAGKRYTDEECFENIAVLWTHFGRQPRCADLKQCPSVVGPKAYIGRWGNWRRALKAFVDWANIEEPNPEDQTDPMTASVLDAIPAPEPDSAILPGEPHEIPLRLRWKVLEGDRFRCRGCGRSPANDLNVVLHVDHIEPWADCRRTVIENLQTLCRECNLGKGRSFAKVE